MSLGRQTAIPTLVRVKPGALDRLGVYLERLAIRHPMVLISEGLPHHGRAGESLRAQGVSPCLLETVNDASFERAVEIFRQAPHGADAIVGIGGGKALDIAKYVALLAGKPCLVVPTSLSNDGFASPQSSLTIEGRRRSLPSVMPLGIVLDTEVCLGAPKALWLSGVGDLVAKLTAVVDWKLAFHARGDVVDDFSALLADGAVYQFLGQPDHDLDGIRRLGSALLLSGISISICGSSRPASGSEHLISHALDELSTRPRLHGLQVGVATYLVSLLQGMNSARIDTVFQKTGFWDEIARDPFDRAEWEAALRLAPDLKPNFFTVLSQRDCLPEAMRFLKDDPRLCCCFR